MKLLILALACGLLTAAVSSAAPPQATLTPSFRAVDLSLGEAVEVTLADQSVAKVKLLKLDEFSKAGDHIVTVEHTNDRGERAQGHLWVRIGE